MLTPIYDFYVLEHIAHKTRFADGIAQKKLHNDVKRYKEQHNKALALCMRDYLFLICCGEARHSKKETTIGMVNSFVGLSRKLSYQHAIDFRPSLQNIQTLERLFALKWTKGYGGRSWGDIAAWIKQYGNVPDPVFVDRIVDLVHNGGMLFDKEEALQIINPASYDVNEPTFRSFLDQKFLYDLDDIGIPYVSPAVARFIKRYNVLFEKNMTYVNTHTYDLTPVTWGDGQIVVEDRITKQYDEYVEATQYGKEKETTEETR